MPATLYIFVTELDNSINIYTRNINQSALNLIVYGQRILYTEYDNNTKYVLCVYRYIDVMFLQCR